MRLIPLYVSALCIIGSSCGNTEQKAVSDAELNEDAEFEQLLHEMDSLGEQQSIDDISNMPFILSEDNIQDFIKDHALRDSIKQANGQCKTEHSTVD